MVHKLIVALAAIALLALLPATAMGSDEGSNPFQGHWVGTDGYDGSRNTLTVGAGNNHVIYRETAIHACNVAFQEVVGGSVAGFATIDGDTLRFTSTLYCNLEDGRAAHPYFSDFDWVVAYDDGTDTVSLVDDPFTTMSRVGR